MRLVQGLRFLIPSASRLGLERTLRLLRVACADSKCARAVRRAAFRAARTLTLHRAVDVTELWNRTHPHLALLDEQVPEGDFLRCPNCGDGKALRILAHYRIGARRWMAARSVLSCAACRRHSLPVHELFLPWLKQVFTAQSREITRIDARLWTESMESLTLEPTTHCNFDCWYCYGRHMKQEHLSYERFVQIVDGNPSLERLQLVGEGEPILNKRFFDMVGYAKERGLRVSITTNGSMFSRSVVEKLCASEIDCIQISIDSADPDRYAETRIGGNLADVWDGIERLTTRRNELGLKRPIVLVRGTFLAKSQDDLAEIVREAKRRGVDALGQFQSLNKKESYVALYPEDQRFHVEESSEVALTARTNRMRSELPLLGELEDLGASELGVWPNPLRSSCDIPTMYCQVGGDLTACCQIKSGSPAWNLAERTTAAVLRDEEYENMRFNLWNGVYLDSCESCRGYTLAHFGRGTPRIRAMGGA